MAHGTLLEADARRRGRRASGRIARGVAIASLAVGSLAAPASADPPGGQGGKVDPGGRQGIENARAAGTYVDPLVEQGMADAPAGSCLNDPTQQKCEKVRAIVYDPDFFSIPLEMRPKMPASATSRRPVKARAAAYNCGVKLVHESPYAAAGYEQMDVQNLCFHPISDLDVYMSLDKYYNGRWYQGMASRWFYPTNPNQYPWTGSLRYGCVSNVARFWRARVHAYVIYQGVWYAGYAEDYDTNNCG